jgi:hypothetical protein
MDESPVGRVAPSFAPVFALHGGGGMSSQQRGALQDSVLPKQKRRTPSRTLSKRKNRAAAWAWKMVSFSAYARKMKLANLLRDMRRVVHARQEPGTAVRGRSFRIS